MVSRSLSQAENWLFKRMWWSVVVVMLVVTFSFQVLYFFLQYRAAQDHVSQYNTNLVQYHFDELQSHLQREYNLINAALENKKFNPELTLERLRDQRFGLENRGYFFILELNNIEGGEDFARHVLLPIAPEEEGKPMDAGLLDANGFAYREDYLAQLREFGEAKVTYWYRKPGTDYASEKTSYLLLIPELNWIIGAGLYLDDFTALIQQYHAAEQARLKQSALLTLAVSLVLILLATVFAVRYNRRSLKRLRHLHQQIAGFQSQMVSYSQRLQLDVEKKSQQLEAMYQFDTLTQAFNRTRLNKDILVVAPQEAVLMVNIDGFKEINEIFGADLGDIILKEIAYKLKHSFIHGRVYRLNGDVFVVIFTPSAEQTLEDLLLSLHHHLVNDRLPQFDDHDVEFNVTIVATLEREKILSRLEMTMLTAKSKRLNVLCYREVFDYAQMYRSNLHITHEIRTAIEQDRVRPVFQAIRDLTSGDITHYECLIRIEEPDGHMMPSTFLTIAQKSKLYPELMKVMLRKSFEAFADSKLNFSINLSYEDIISEDVQRTIMGLLNEDNASRVIFEILESEGIENYPEVSRFITEVKSRGCKIAIDDFGTGYSNFEHVLKLHVDYIKLDGSLIQGLLHNEDAIYIVESIVYFAKRVGIKVIAEFVSEPALVDKVKALNIDYAQGYAIAYPETTFK